MLELNWWLVRLRWLGLLAIMICAATWAVELLGLVYVCPFCRTQRTVIGLLGLLAMTPSPGHWIIRYFATVFAAYGFNIGATQHFRGWVKIMSGEFSWGEKWYVNSWMLSGFALFIITALVLAIWAWPSRRVQS